MARLSNKGTERLTKELDELVKLPLVLLVAIVYLLAIPFLTNHGLVILLNFLVIVVGLVVYTLIKNKRNLPLLIALFPIVGILIAYDKQIRQYRDEIERLQAALEPYRLWIFNDSAEELARKVPANENSAAEYYAHEIAKKNDAVASELYQEVLLVLYEAMSGSSKSARWNMRKNQIAERVADILIQNHRLAPPPPGTQFSLEKKELARLIVQLDEFSERAVNKQVMYLIVLWTHASAYLQFLAEQQVAPLE